MWHQFFNVFSKIVKNGPENFILLHYTITLISTLAPSEGDGKILQIKQNGLDEVVNMYNFKFQDCPITAVKTNDKWLCHKRKLKAATAKKRQAVMATGNTETVIEVDHDQQKNWGPHQEPNIPCSIWLILLQNASKTVKTSHSWRSKTYSSEKQEIIPLATKSQKIRFNSTEKWLNLFFCIEGNQE